MAPSNAGIIPNLESSGAGGDDDIPELEAVEEEGPVDETGVDPKDIELVIQQVGCSRAKAVKVLKESGGDLINASTCTALCPYLHPLTISSQSWQRASDQILPLYFYLLLYRFIQKQSRRVYPMHSGVLFVHLRRLSSRDVTCKLKELTRFPTSELYVIIRSFPAVLYDLNAFHGLSLCRRANMQPKLGRCRHH